MSRNYASTNIRVNYFSEEKYKSWLGNRIDLDINEFFLPLNEMMDSVLNKKELLGIAPSFFDGSCYDRLIENLKRAIDFSRANLTCLTPEARCNLMRALKDSVDCINGSLYCINSSTAYDDFCNFENQYSALLINWYFKIQFYKDWCALALNFTALDSESSELQRKLDGEIRKYKARSGFFLSLVVDDISLKEKKLKVVNASVLLLEKISSVGDYSVELSAFNLVLTADENIGWESGNVSRTRQLIEKIKFQLLIQSTSLRCNIASQVGQPVEPVIATVVISREILLEAVAKELTKLRAEAFGSTRYSSEINVLLASQTLLATETLSDKKNFIRVLSNNFCGTKSQTLTLVQDILALYSDVRTMAEAKRDEPKNSPTRRESSFFKQGADIAQLDAALVPTTPLLAQVVLTNTTEESNRVAEVSLCKVAA